MSQTITLTISPGVTVNQNLPSVSKISTVDFANSSPFDLTYQGFGSPGVMIITAGTIVRLHHEVLDTGQVSFLPVNNYGVLGNGIVNLTVYFINETVPPGTYPVAIPTQTVKANVSQVTTLSNEGASAGAEVIDMGDTAFSKLVDLFNDGHGTWSVDQSGVKHQVLLWSASGNPLVVGQAGDTVPFNGAVTIAQALGITGVTTATGNIIANGGMNNNTFRDNTVGNTQITLSNASPQVTIANDLAVTGTIQPNKPSVTVNGSVGGSCIFTDAVWGSGLKIETVFLNGWNSATVATHTFPSGITIGWYFSNFGSAQASPTWDLFIGSTAQIVRHLLTLGAANAAGTDNAETAIHSDNIGSFALTGGAATSMQVGTVAGAVSGALIIIGI